jgi:hypothetical protein
MRLAGVIFLVCLCASLFVSPAAGYAYSQTNQTFEGYLGNTIDLSGVSYNSKEVYLFMTGPGLPDDGVTLTDTTKLASQGQFNMIDVDSSQQWSFTWDTSRIENNINPGTYTVYVVNAPVDKSNLAGHSYQALIVYLKDTGNGNKGSVSVGTSYTLNPRGLTDDTTVTSTITTAPPTAPPTIIVPNTIVTTLPNTIITSTPTQRSASLPWAALLGVAVIGVVRVYSRKE